MNTATQLISLPAHAVKMLNNKAMTCTTVVAEIFGKKHKDVLRTCKSLECSTSFHERNFAPIQIEVEIGLGKKRKSPAFSMTKDGFMFLVMGFTGARAAQFKEAFIAKFNEMERELRGERLDLERELEKRQIESAIYDYEYTVRECVKLIGATQDAYGKIFRRAKEWAVKELRNELREISPRYVSDWVSKSEEKQEKVVRKNFYTTTDLAEELGFGGAVDLRILLTELGIMEKVANSSGYVLSEEYDGLGYGKRCCSNSGGVLSGFYMRWTEVGRKFVIASVREYLGK